MFIEILIGLEQTVYSIDEGQTAEICVAILGSTELAPEVSIIATLTAVPETAEGDI